MKKSFVFTVDDNIRFLKELTDGAYSSIFEHPYMAVYKRLHEKFGLKVQLNLFYSTTGFTLSQMTDAYLAEWKENSDWLKLSFHSKLENYRPYESSPYSEVFDDCSRVHQEILRFAGKAALAKTTTLHYCRATNDGLSAMRDNGVAGLLGLFGTPDEPKTSYGIDVEYAEKIRSGETVFKNRLYFSGIDIVLNQFDTEEILKMLDSIKTRISVKIMIHEQYFYPDYPKYQNDFEEKLSKVFSHLTKDGRESIFFQELI